MNDQDFLDLLYQQWAKTTGAENQFWTVEVHSIEDTDNEDGTTTTTESYAINAVAQDQSTAQIAYGLTEVDADFVAGLHGAVGDLVRRMHAALDEADRADRERDEQEQSIFALAVENDELKQEVSQLRRERESWVSRAGDTLWKIERPM